MHYYYLQAWYIRVASRVAEWLKILKNWEKSENSQDFIEWQPSASRPPKWKFFAKIEILAKNSWKIEIKVFPYCAISHENYS